MNLYLESSKYFDILISQVEGAYTEEILILINTL